MEPTSAINLVFGGHSPIGIEISRSLGGYLRTIHVSRNVDTSLNVTLNGSKVDLLQWEFFNPNFSSKEKRILKSNRIQNLIFAHKFNSSENQNTSDIFESEVLFPCAIIEFLIDQALFAPQSNIIFISSPAARFILDDQPLGYHISKSAINQVVRYFANKIGTTTKVNAVSPGSFVIKDRNREFLKPDTKYGKALQELLPTGTVPEIEDIVQVIEYLISSRNNLINGQIIDLSGGYLNIEPSHLFRKLFHDYNS